MQNSPWPPLLRRLAVVMGAYSLLRLLFFFHNHTAFAEVSAGQIGLAFFYGLRFDASAVVVTNSVFIMLSLLPLRVPPGIGYQRLLKTVFLAVNFFCLAINLIDLEFFQFTGRRFDRVLLGMVGDEGVKWSHLGLYYWPLVLLSVLMLAAMFLLYGRVRAPTGDQIARRSWWAWSISLVVAIGLSIVAVRGGLQWKPIRPAQAAVFNHSGLAQLTLNSTFTIFKNYRRSPLRRHNYFGAEEELRRYLRGFVDGKNLLPAPATNDNVVILVVESLSMEYCGAGNGGGRYTPFLDSLAEQSLFFSHNYANGRRSIEAMPSILAGLPSLMGPSFTESLYCDHPLLGLGTLLSPHGYTTSFFHGAPNGTMTFDVFMQVAGIQNYFGLHEYPNKSDFDGTWGIFDEPYLQYVAAQLTGQKAPFAAVVFTVSSHNPYRIPPEHRGRFKKGTLEIHETVGYTDYALRRFFETARQQPWYSNTLFIITGDHTQKLETPQYANPLGHYRVPLMFFHPQKKIPGVDAGHVTQHADILPSLLDYLGLQPDRQLLFGRSVFRDGEGRAFLHENDRYWLVRSNRVLEFTPGSPGRLFDFAHDPQLESPVTDEPQRRGEMEREAQALVQYFNNGLLDRALYDPVGPDHHPPENPATARPEK